MDWCSKGLPTSLLPKAESKAPPRARRSDDGFGSFHDLIQALVLAHEQEVQDLRDQLIGHGINLGNHGSSFSPFATEHVVEEETPTHTDSRRVLTQGTTRSVDSCPKATPTENLDLEEVDEILASSNLIGPRKPGDYDGSKKAIANPEEFRDLREKVQAQAHAHQEQQDIFEVPWLHSFLLGPFDVFMSGVIVVNAWVLFVQLAVVGHGIGVLMGIESGEPWEHTAIVFFVCEHVFQGIYCFELVLRIVVLRKDFCFHPDTGGIQKFNWFDVLVVLLGCFDLYLLPVLGVEGASFGFLRLIRVARLSRTLKIIRVLKAFSKLRVLVQTIMSSLMALFWAMVLLFLLIFIASMFLCQTIQQTLEEGVAADLLNATGTDVLAKDIRETIYYGFGTSPRALWTIFEVTLGGEGASLFRPLIDNVSGFYTIFVAGYISFAVFAVICIIQALFLKDTLDIAANDAEAMVQEHIAIRNQYTKQLHEVFVAADTSRDGRINLEEFEQVMSVTAVQEYMQVLDLEVSEVVALFNMLDNGGGSVSYDEFVTGIMRLKGQARSMDVVTVMSDCRKIFEKCQDIEQQLQKLGGLRHRHNSTPWKASTSVAPTPTTTRVENNAA